jgi:urate oxidase
VTLSTHVLDATVGRPAAGIRVLLERRSASAWTPVGRGQTGPDGRLKDWLPAGEPTRGVYRITFASGSYREVRTATVSHDGDDSWVVSGLRELTVLNSAGSEFWGFAKDRCTTLAETTDRILATAVHARWRYVSLGEWAESYRAARELLLRAFAETYSYSLQQTLFAMGQRVLDGRPEIAEIRLSLPNKHHFEVDMSPAGLGNRGEAFYASDRPYGLIEGTVLRDDAPPPGKAW